MAVAFLAAACGRSAGAPVTVATVGPGVLSQLVLDPGDLGNDYTILSDRYLDQDGNAVAGVTDNFMRQLQRKPSLPAGAPPASRISVTLSNEGLGAATDFMDSADDVDVGPPNLEDYIHKQVPDSRDAHAALVDDFPTYGDDTVANKITWQSGATGQEVTWHSYSVYIRSGGVLALVSARAEDTGHGEPEGLRKQAESLVKREADKLHNGRVPPPILGTPSSK